MLSAEALQTILSIQGKVHLTPKEMADTLNLTFYPYDTDSVSKEVREFGERLEASLRRLKVNLVPFNEALISVPFWKTFFRGLKIIANNVLYGLGKMIHRDSGRHFIHFEALLNLLTCKRIKRGI